MELKSHPDIALRKIFDMKMKQGNEMKKVYLDEVSFYNFLNLPLTRQNSFILFIF